MLFWLEVIGRKNVGFRAPSLGFSHSLATYCVVTWAGTQNQGQNPHLSGLVRKILMKAAAIIPGTP